MRAVIQRVTRARVTVADETVGKIGSGLVVLVGVEKGDTEADALYIADKTVNLRVFEDADDKLNLSVKDTKGAVLLVSQFTLLGDVRKGRRPSFTDAENPDEADRLYLLCKARIEENGVSTETGRFRTHMNVELANDGPVTILLDSRKRF